MTLALECTDDSVDEDDMMLVEGRLMATLLTVPGERMAALKTALGR